MLGARSASNDHEQVVVRPWQWTDPTYTFAIPTTIGRLRAVTVDPIGRMADKDQSNDQIVIDPGTQEVIGN